MKSTSSYKLSELLIPKQLMFSVKPLDTYKQIKLRIKHQGVELRSYKKGNEIGSKQYLAKKGQFIISKIDARNGAMGIIPESLDNAIVTSDFLLYDINESLIHPKYFNYISQMPSFDDSCKKCSEGSTNRVRLKLDKFLDLSIELPSREIQEATVDKIESIKSKIETIKKLRAEQEKEIGNLLYSKYINTIANAEWLPMKEVAPIIRRPVVIEDETLYPELGIRCFGNGTFHKPALTGLEIGTKKIFQIKTDDLVFSNVFAWEGGIAIAKEEDNNRYGSHRFISCLVDDKKTLVEFLCFHFLSPKGLEDINACSPGGAGRNKTLGLDKLMKIKVPIPSLASQKEFVELLRKTNAIKEHHKQTEKELNELLPSLLDKAFKGELFSDKPAEIIPIPNKPEVSYTQSLIPSNRIGFAKQVLGGKIVSLFKDDKHFTNIKFQKLQYLAEHIIEEDLYWNYYRQSAGPYDNKFMHSVFSKLEQNQWFVNRNYKFYPLQKANDIERHYQNYFGNKKEKLSNLFGLLLNASEKFCEAIATIYAVWNNHIIQNQAFNKSKIKTDFFDWSIRKEQQFTEEEFEKALEWMNKHNIIPTGFGSLIKEKK